MRALEFFGGLLWMFVGYCIWAVIPEAPQAPVPSLYQVQWGAAITASLGIVVLGFCKCAFSLSEDFKK